MTGRVRFLVIVDGLVEADDTALVDLDDPDSMWPWVRDLAERHADIATRADRAGRRYLVEVEWWDGERTRWGTDVDGMVVPVEVGLHELAEAIGRRWL